MTPTNTTHLILVNEADEAIGTMEKMKAHRSPHLHRAFSIFLFDQQGRMLLQQRAHTKYHSSGLWTNACCSHPYPDEPTEAAANRRLQEELGLSVPLQKAFHFTYQASFDNGLFEHEFDHVFIGQYHGETLHPHPEEVADYCFKSIADIQQEMEQKPELYTAWFKIALPLLQAHLQTTV